MASAQLFNNTLAVNGGTLTAGDDTLAIDGGTLMSGSQHRLGSAVTRPNNTLKTKIQSCTPHMAKLDSIRTIVIRVQIREENLYLFLTLLFSQYLYVDLTRCHVSMVIGSATTKSPR
jgi:hypothetical protein